MHQIIHSNDIDLYISDRRAEDLLIRIIQSQVRIINCAGKHLYYSKCNVNLAIIFWIYR